MEAASEKTYTNVGNSHVLGLMNDPGTVLDLGCGGGDNARILRTQGYIIDGITISKAELETALPFLRNGYLYNLEEGLPADVKKSRYDYILCSHVLEHICFPEKLLSDIKGCLTQKGVLIVALPNLFHYSSRWKLMMGKFEYQDAGIWDNTHFRWYSYESGAKLLERNGFSAVHKDVTGDLPLASVFKNVFSNKTAQFIFSLLKKLSPGFFGYQLIYVARIK